MDDLLQREAGEMAENIRRLFAELDRAAPGAAAATGECRPPLDVLETAATIEVVMDLAGVARPSIRVAIRRNAVLLVGAKVVAAPASPSARFHLAERSSGRFARVVRVTGAIDARRARAVVASGQLRVILPRVAERRGQLVDVAVEQG